MIRDPASFSTCPFHSVASCATFGGGSDREMRGPPESAQVVAGTREAPEAGDALAADAELTCTRVLPRLTFLRGRARNDRAEGATQGSPGGELAKIALF
jgi:hypothetical protein